MTQIRFSGVANCAPSPLSSETPMSLPAFPSPPSTSSRPSWPPSGLFRAGGEKEVVWGRISGHLCQPSPPLALLWWPDNSEISLGHTSKQVSDWHRRCILPAWCRVDGSCQAKTLRKGAPLPSGKGAHTPPLTWRFDSRSWQLQGSKSSVNGTFFKNQLYWSIVVLQCCVCFHYYSKVNQPHIYLSPFPLGLLPT